MDDGLDLKELTKFETDLMKIANDFLPKESKKFLKKQGTKLSKKNKQAYDSCGVGSGENKEVAKAFKAGKVYKYDSALAIRAYNGAIVTNKDGSKKYSFGAMMNNGYRHINRDGTESWVAGYHFMEKASSEFQSEYVENCQEFVNQIVDKINE